MFLIKTPENFNGGKCMKNPALLDMQKTVNTLMQRGRPRKRTGKPFQTVPMAQPTLCCDITVKRTKKTA